MDNSDSLETIEKKRKRLIFRSWHRGTREMDLVMGTFADSHAVNFDMQELDLYEQLLENSDPDLYNWVSGREEVPANKLTSVMQQLLNHHVASNLIKSNIKIN